MKNILSIDGGGVKSYIPLRILNEIEKRTMVPISELFEYFSGVSAGALICSLLILKDGEGKQKYSTDEILNIFEEQCHIIFKYTYSEWIKTGFGLFSSSYDSVNIKKSMEDYFSNTTIMDLKKPISMITFDLVSNKPFHINRNKYGDLFVKDCLLATTAAPTYFDPYSLYIGEQNFLFVDGGVVTCNPVEHCFLDAYQYYNNKSVYSHEGHNDTDDIFYTLSLGTGYYQPPITTPKSNPNPFNNGILGWSAKIIDTLFNANKTEENYELRLIEKFIKGNKMNRIDLKLDRPINLDDVGAFYSMKILTEKWISENDDLINKLCKELLANFNNH